MNSKTVFAIVDPFSSGLELARTIKAGGHRCIMVQSGEEIPPMYRSSFHAEAFDSILQHQGDTGETAASLKAANVNFVLAGCEMGVELSDQLSEKLGLLTNGTRRSAARRNKHLMVDALRECGVPAPDSFASGSLDEIGEWIRARGRFPIVLKPRASSGSDGVRLCRDERAVAAAFENIMGRKDVFGSTNEAVLVQEYLSGTEYAVDTVSCRGRHRIAAFWEYSKADPDGVVFGSDSLELLPWSPSLEKNFSSYVASILDALEITNGPAHCELVLGCDKPLIVEIGARLNGGNNPLLSRYGGGKSQIDLTLDACLNPEEFLRVAGEPYRLPKRAMRVFLMPRRQGRWKTRPALGAIERLDSFHEVYCSSKPGQPVSRITGWVVLVHADRSVIRRDRQIIRQMEAEGLYPIEID
jgi:biotin carboxylase